MAGKAQEVFENAVGLTGAEREAYLRGACGADEPLRAEIDSLFRAYERGAAFLARPTGVHPSDAGAAMITSAPLGEGPGTRIGPYKILQLIGEGGFGSVFMAEQEKPVQRRVALKIIKLGMDTRAVIARFEAERQALALMDHPNIARVLDAGATDTGRPYFVMELCKGDPIHEYCDKNKLSITNRLELFEQVCLAVQHAHTKGIIHRDIKPSNILVSTQDGRPLAKAIDFGIAKATASRLTEKTLFTEHRALIGTPEYMSPEQAEGSLDIDTRTDVYSLGVLLYELLTGTTPFSGSDLRSAAYAEIQRIIREVEPPNPSTRLSHNTDTLASVAAHRHTEPKKLGPLVRGELDWIVMKALEKDRQRRYETANGLAMDIRRYLAGEAVQAAPPSTAYRLKKFVRRHRGPVTAGAALLLTLLLGLAGTVWKADEAKREAKRANTEAAAARTAEGEQRRLAEAESRAKQAAQEAQGEALAQLRRSEWLVYAGKLTVAQNNFEDGNGGLARHYLEECQPDLRGWEWRHLWSRVNPKLTLTGHLNGVSSVAVSPDGRRVVTGSEDGLAKLWDAATGRELLTLEVHFGMVMAVAFSPDGQRFVTGGGPWGEGKHPGVLKVWDTASGGLVHVLPGHNYCVWSAAFSPDGRRIVSGAGDWGYGPGEVKVWDAGSGQEVLTLTGRSGTGKCVAFSPDGRRIVSGVPDVWDADTGQVVLTLQGHEGFVRDAAFSPDGRRIAAGNKVWDAATGQELFALRGHAGWVNSVTFSPDGHRLLTGSSDQTIKVWDAAAGREMLTIKGHGGYVRDVAFSPDGQRIFAASNDHTVKVWDPIRGQEVPVLKGHTESIRSIAFSPDGSRIVTGSADGTAKVWDTTTWQEVLTVEHAKVTRSETGVWGVAFSPDGGRILTGSADHTAQVWDAVTGRSLLVLKHNLGVGAVAFSPDGRRVVTGTQYGDQGEARLWDANTGEELLTLKDAKFVSRVEFSPDGTRIVTSCADHIPKVWDAATGQVLFVLKGHTHDVYSVTYSRDGQRIATGSADGTAKVWDAATGGELLTLKGHTGGVRHVRFTPDGERIVTASDDQSAKIWNARTGQELFALRQHPTVLWGLAVSPDGQTIVTGTGEIAKVWYAPPPVTGQGAGTRAASGTGQPQ